MKISSSLPSSVQITPIIPTKIMNKLFFQKKMQKCKKKLKKATKVSDFCVVKIAMMMFGLFSYAQQQAAIVEWGGIFFVLKSGIKTAKSVVAFFHYPSIAPLTHSSPPIVAQLHCEQQTLGNFHNGNKCRQTLPQQQQ